MVDVALKRVAVHAEDHTNHGRFFLLLGKASRRRSSRLF